MADSPTPPPAERPSVGLPAAITAALVLFFGFRAAGGEAIDLAFQSPFWSAAAGWMVPRDSMLGNVLAYDGP